LGFKFLTVAHSDVQPTISNIFQELELVKSRHKAGYFKGILRTRIDWKMESLESEKIIKGNM